MSRGVDVKFIVWAPSCELNFEVNHGLPVHIGATLLTGQFIFRNMSYIAAKSVFFKLMFINWPAML